MSQAEADDNAYEFACQLAALLCTGPLPTLFTNTAQSCTVNCPDQTTFTYTVPAGFFTALSQAEADANAYVFACAVAALLCSGLPPTGTSPGAGTEPEPPSQPLYSNYAQTCTSACANGSTFTYTAEGGLYQAESRDAANAIAHSYACAQANARRFCLDDLPAAVCVGDFFFDSVTTDGSPGPLTYSLVGGALPPGLFLASTGFLSGIPTTPGTSSFTIRATSANGSSDRTYSMAAIEITPDTLPDATLGSPYSEALSDAGTTGSVTWAIESGSLPTGLTLNPNTGVISGTPTVSGDFDFSVSVTDSEGACAKDLSITVAGDYLWWKMEEATGNRIDSIQSVALVPYTTGAATVTGPAGKILFGAQLNKSLTSSGAMVGLLTTLVPEFAFVAGDSFTIAGWVRRISGTAFNPDNYLQLDLYDDAIGSTLLASVIFQETGGSSTFFVQDNVGPGLSVKVIATGIPIGTFFFFALIYNGATGIVSGQINGGGIQVGAGVANISTSPFGTLLLKNSGAAANNANQWDEIGVFPTALTQAQVDYLYNAGSGQTSPITLP